MLSFQCAQLYTWNPGVILPRVYARRHKVLAQGHRAQVVFLQAKAMCWVALERA